MNGIALVLALLIVLIAIPGFNTLSGQQLSFSLFGQSSVLVTYLHYLLQVFSFQVYILHLCCQDSSLLKY